MTTKLGPWPAGLDNLTPDADLAPAALRAADDVLIDENGTVNSGVGPRLAVAAPGLGSLWRATGGATYGVLGSRAVRVSLGGLAELGEIGADGRGCFAEHAGQVIACSRAGLFRLGAQVEPLALPAPAFAVTAAPNGGLDAGRYGVAVAALRDGEEFGLSPIRFVDVPQGGGLSLSIAGEGMARIYRTGANGDELYRAVDAPAGIPDYLIGAGQLGALPAGRNLHPLPGGHLLQSWSGRLLVASGRTLYFSQPLRPGLHDPRHDFVRLPSRISMVAPVQDGIYLADRLRTYFLAGTDPAQWALLPLEALPPAQGAFAVVPGSLFDKVPAVPVALWLGPSGFVLGLPGGQIALPQASRLRLPASLSGSLTVFGRRLFALAH